MIGARNGAALHGKRVHFPADEPLVTDGGRVIATLTIAYETYGALNEAKSNAILLCHALTGDQYAAGGCMVTTGPASINPATGLPFGLDFPVVTIRDMVRAQAMLIEHLGIETLFCVAGGSMGGMQVLQWAASYPERVFTAMPIASAPRHSSQNIAF